MHGGPGVAAAPGQVPLPSDAPQEGHCVSASRPGPATPTCPACWAEGPGASTGSWWGEAGVSWSPWPPRAQRGPGTAEAPGPDLKVTGSTHGHWHGHL